MSTQKRTKGKQIKRYSAAFQQKVVSELERGELSIEQVRAKYGIGGSTTIQRWIKKLGKNDLLCKVVTIQTPMEQDQLKVLRQRIAELERALAQTQVECLQSESYLQLACQELGTSVADFKKKETSQPAIGTTRQKPPA